jgi:poly(A) polymerase
MKIIKKFLDLLSGSGSTPEGADTSPEPVVVARDGHSVSRRNIDGDALKVLNRLNRFDHTAYLVGGGVRDLLLRRKVKDFDIATSAHPNEVKKLFRNCRLVGRRFRLAHILFRGGKVIEVSTFRRHAGFGDADDLLIKSDNTFGNAEEDALRRDFTVNGLFYNIADFTVIDYVGGLKDIEAKVIATIGKPGIRFREDPIRMLRALRFAARLGFTLAPATARALEKHRKEVWKAAVQRILEEILRMLQQGSAADSFRLMDETGFLKVLLPRLAADYASEETGDQIRRNLAAIDAMKIPDDRMVTSFLTAILYFPSFLAESRRADASADRLKMAGLLLEEDLAKLQFPRLQMERARQLLAAQHRIENIGKKKIRPSHLVRKSYFDDALTVFEITRPPSRENRAIVRRWRTLMRDVKGDAPPKKTGEATKDGAPKEGASRRRSRSGSRRRRGPRKKPENPSSS